MSAALTEEHGWKEPKRPFGKALRYFHRLAILKANITWDDLITQTGRRHQFTQVDQMQTVAATCQLIIEGTQVVVAALGEEDDKIQSTEIKTQSAEINET